MLRVALSAGSNRCSMRLSHNSTSSLVTAQNELKYSQVRDALSCLRVSELVACAGECDRLIPTRDRVAGLMGPSLTAVSIPIGPASCYIEI